MSDSDITLVTGSTGFVGHYVLAALLRRGASCAAMVRSRVGDAVRLRRLLREIDPSPWRTPINESRDARPERAGDLLIVEGSLPDDLPDLRRHRIGRIVHLAADTRFSERDGEPFRTNVEGTRRLLEWADGHNVRDLTLVSTAFVCGQRQGVVLEDEPDLADSRGIGLADRDGQTRVHNAYEASKQQAEALCRGWARRSGRRLTIARPGVIVGDFGSGRATAFRGFYLVARAVALLSRMLDDAPPATRHGVTLRLPGQADYPNHMVPVDFVAEAVAHLALDQRQGGGAYHLTHPQPPTLGDVQRWLEEYFDLGGGCFVGDRIPDVAQRTPYEALFHAGAHSVFSYFLNAPSFATRRATAELSRAGIVCPAIDGAYVRRLVRYAQHAGWGRRAVDRTSEAEASGANAPDDRRATPAAADLFAAYFERFLPEHLPRSTVARMTPVRATIRFVIDGAVGAEWVCRFDAGRLVCLSRGANGVCEEFGYRATPQAFWDAVGGQVEGEALFMTQQADVFGDVEKALKMSAILREFTREFPCNAARLMPYLKDSRAT